jgi:hypothetical protein
MRHLPESGSGFRMHDLVLLAVNAGNGDRDDGTLHLYLGHDQPPASSCNFRLLPSIVMIATPPISSVARQVSNKGYVFSSFVTFDQHDLFIKGDHSLFLLGDTIEVSKVTVVFKGIDFQVQGAHPPLWVVQGGTLIVIDSIFQGGQQPLDNISWIDVQFRDMQPQYHREAIRLRNVSFTGFNRDRLFLDLPHDLAQLILESGGKPINYVFEPEK